MSTETTGAAGLNRLPKPLALVAATLVAIALMFSTVANAPSASATPVAATATPAVAPRTGTWVFWGYVLNRSETNRIASLSLRDAVSGVKGTRLIPYSQVIIALYAYTWVLTARNARDMGQCLAINYFGTGIIANCR